MTVSVLWSNATFTNICGNKRVKVSPNGTTLPVIAKSVALSQGDKGGCGAGLF